MTPAIATLVVGCILGYLFQRSRMCFIGGLRDFILVRDTSLLKGLLAFAVTAWVLFSAVHRISFPRPDFVTVALTACGGFGVGFVSVLANGCPFRQHVLAAQGVKSSAVYLIGFLAGAVLFHAWVAPFLFRLLP